MRLHAPLGYKPRPHVHQELSYVLNSSDENILHAAVITWQSELPRKYWEPAERWTGDMER